MDSVRLAAVSILSLVTHFTRYNPWICRPTDMRVIHGSLKRPLAMVVQQISALQWRQ
jgi:hypothetical protein